MNKEINQTCQKINYQDILSKKSYPVWFFTNERINYFLPRIEKNKEIKKIFSIGSGDFIFSLLSSQALNQIDEINICDIRQMANISIDFKIALFKNLEYEEVLKFFLGQKVFHKKEIYERIEKTITQPSRKIFDFLVKNCQQDDLLKCLKKSGFWFGHSFWQINQKQEYLPYLFSKEKFELLQKRLDKITIYCGDLEENLKLFKNDYYDLIYISNLLDSKKYCQEPDLYLQTIKEKLEENGLLFVAVQNKPKKIIKLVERQDFRLYEKQLHKFNIISSFFGHYAYSFLLFKKMKTGVSKRRSCLSDKKD